MAGLAETNPPARLTGITFDAEINPAFADVDRGFAAAAPLAISGCGRGRNDTRRAARRRGPGAYRAAGSGAIALVESHAVRAPLRRVRDR